MTIHDAEPYEIGGRRTAEGENSVVLLLFLLRRRVDGKMERTKRRRKPLKSHKTAMRIATNGVRYARPEQEAAKRRSDVTPKPSATP
jgi:hypothetical protein